MTYFAPVANLDTVLCRGSFPVDVPSPCHTIGTFQSYVYFVGGSGENGDPSSDESGTVTFADLTATGESYTIGLEHNTSILSVCEGQPHELWLGTSNGITILHEPLREPRTDVLALPPDTCILHLVLTDGGEKIISCDQSGHIDVWCTRKKMKLYMLGVVPLPLSAPIFRASHTRFLCGNHMWSNQEAESGVVLDILSPWGIEGKHTSRRAHPITRKDSAMTVPHTTSPDLIDALILEPLRGVCILWCVRRGSLEAFGIADAPHDVPNHCEFNKGPNVVILTALYHIPFTGVEAPIHAVTLVGSFSDGYDPSSSQELLASWTKEGLKGMNKHEAAFGNSNTSSAASTTPMLMVSSGNRGMISAIHAFSGARLFTETLSQLAKHSASPRPEAGSEAPLLEGCSVNDSGTAETRHLLYVCRAAMDVIWSVTSDARETEPQCVVFTTERLLRQTAAQRLPELSKRIELKCTEENTREVVAKSPVQRAEVGVQSENFEPSPPPVRTYTELELQEMLTEIKASSKLEVDAARTRAAHLEECLDASERQLSLLTESVRDLNDCLENVRLERDRLDTAYKAVLQETVPIVAREYDASSVATPRTVNQQPAGRVGVRALGPNIPSTKMTARGHEVRFGGALSAQHRSATHRNAQQHNSSNRIPVAAPSQQPTRGTSAERLCTPQRSTGLPSVTTGGSMIERAAEPVSHNTGTDHMNGTGILHTLSCELKVHVGELHAVIRDLWGQIESARLQGTAVSAAHVYHLTHAARTIVGSVLAESHALHQGLVVSSTGSVSGNSIAPSTANPK